MYARTLENLFYARGEWQPPGDLPPEPYPPEIPELPPDETPLPEPPEEEPPGPDETPPPPPLETRGQRSQKGRLLSEIQ